MTQAIEQVNLPAIITAIAASLTGGTSVFGDRVYTGNALRDTKRPYLVVTHVGGTDRGTFGNAGFSQTFIVSGFMDMDVGASELALGMEEVRGILDRNTLTVDMHRLWPVAPGGFNGPEMDATISGAPSGIWRMDLDFVVEGLRDAS